MKHIMYTYRYIYIYSAAPPDDGRPRLGAEGVAGEEVQQAPAGV